MSKTPWDSGGMNQHGSFDNNLGANFSNDVQHPQLGYGVYTEPTANSVWNQNNLWYPEENVHKSQQEGLDPYSYTSMANSGESSTFVTSQAQSEHDNRNYGFNYANSFPHWSGPSEHADGQHHHNPHDQYSGYVDGQFQYQNFVPQQHRDVKSNQQPPRSDSFGSQELLGKSEAASTFDDNTLKGDSMMQSPANELTKEEMQTFETNLHSSDQLMASEPPTAYSSSEPLLLGPPPVGTMTGIPTGNQFRKVPLKKSAYQVSDSLSNQFGNLELFSSDQKPMVLLGIGDNVDATMDSSFAVTEDSLDQKLADIEVASYNKSHTPPYSLLDPANGQPLEKPTQPALPAKPLEEMPLQTERHAPASESEARQEKELKQVSDDEKLISNQIHSSDIFNPPHYLSRKKHSRDSTFSPATTLWDNIDVTPLKLGPKLVPTQEVEPAASSDEGMTASSPVLQNTGTGPSYNSLTAETFVPGISEKQLPVSSVVHKSFVSDTANSTLSLDSMLAVSKNDFQSPTSKEEVLVSPKEYSTENPVSAVTLVQDGRNQRMETQQHLAQLPPAGPVSEQEKQYLPHDIQSLQHNEPQHGTSKLKQQPQQQLVSQQPLHQQSVSQQPLHQQLVSQQPLHQQSVSQQPLQQQLQLQCPLESERQKQQPLIVSPQISDPHLSAFSTVRPGVPLNCPPNPSTAHGSNPDVQGNEKMQSNLSLSNAPASANRKTTFSALNPEPASEGRFSQPRLQNNDPSKRQGLVGTYNEGQRQQDPRPISRQGNDRPFLQNEVSQREYDDDPSRYQRPDSRSSYSDARRRPYEERPYERTSSRQGYNPEAQIAPRPSLSRPSSRADEFYDDRRGNHPGDYEPRGRPVSQHSAYNERDRFQESSRKPGDSRTQGIASDRNRYAEEEGYHKFDERSPFDGRPKYQDDRERYPRDRSRHPDERSRHPDERSRYPDERPRYPDERSRYSDERSRYPDERSRYDADKPGYPDNRPRYTEDRYIDDRHRYQENRQRYEDDRYRHQDDRSRYYSERAYPDRRSKYGDDRHRELDDSYRSRSRQGYPEGHYRSKVGDGQLSKAYEEAYDRPRSRQEDPYQSVANKMEKDYNEYYRQYYKEMMRYYYEHPGQKYPEMDPYLMAYQHYMDSYSKGYYEEAASYGVPGQLLTSGVSAQLPGGLLPSMHPMVAGMSSRTSSRNFDPYTAADQFARESQRGSRPTSQFSEFMPDYVEEKKRLTPFKFSRSHVRASFSRSGQLVQVMPNNPTEGQPAQVRILSLCDTESEEVKELIKYPGPLVRGVHKNNVQDFCKQMSLKCKDDFGLVDKSSAQLIWDFLVLLIKQNGFISGTDVAELLTQGKDFSVEQNDSFSNPEADDFGSNVRSGFDRSLVVHSDRLEQLSADQIASHFRGLLLCGRKKDALDWAMKQNLWGHALYLASQMDAKTHAIIKTKFTNVSMKANDPLQTLYQILGGRQPSSVTLLDERWGDWRPHLSMIVANPTSKPDLDKRSLVTLGDTLASRGLLHASHFCYLVAQTLFGNFSTKNLKLVLVGSRQGLPLNQFATNPAIWATEVYEYAISLAEPNFVMSSLVTYKFIYMIRLLDLGLFEEVLKYAEVIAQSIVKNPGIYSPAIIKFIGQLSTTMRMWDPQHKDSVVSDEEIGQEPLWCTNLASIVKMVDEGVIHFREGTSSPRLSSAGTNSEFGELVVGGHPNPAAEDIPDNQWTGHSYPQPGQGPPLPGNWSNPNQEPDWTNNQQYWTNQQQPRTATLAQPQQSFVYGSQDTTGYSNVHIPLFGDDVAATTQHPEAIAFQQQHQQYPAFTIGNVEMGRIPEESSHDILYGQQQQQSQSANRGIGSRSRTTSSGSNASKKSSGVTPSTPGRSRDDPFQFGVKPLVSNNSLMSGMDQPLGAHSPSVKDKKKQPLPNDDSDDFTIKKPEASEKKTIRGWLKEWLTKPKECHLPDDSNMKFGWDESKKQWVNKEGDAVEDQEPAPPPPVVQSVGPSDQTGGNMFSKVPKTRGARGQYRDIMGGTVDHESSFLIPTLPKSASVPANIFIPTPPKDENEASPNQQVVEAQQEHPYQQQQHHQQHQQQQQQHQQQQHQHQQQQMLPQLNPSQISDNNYQQQQQLFQTQFFDPSQVRNAPQTSRQGPPWMNNRASYRR